MLSVAGRLEIYLGVMILCRQKCISISNLKLTLLNQIKLWLIILIISNDIIISALCRYA